MVGDVLSDEYRNFCVTFESQVINIKHQFFRYYTMMNQEDIFKKIGQILNELSDQYQYLAQNPQELNELELELFLANANFLSDHVQIIRKLNNGSAQKALPEHTQQEEVVLQPAVVPALEIHEADEEPAAVQAPQFTPSLEEDIFKPDNEPSPFEFILNDKSSDKFEFEEKSVDEIFDRPLSKEEELIIAQKQKLREKDSLGAVLPEEDEIGPEPFLVADPSAVTEAEPEEIAIQPEITEIQLAATPVIEFIPETEEPVQQQPETIEEEPVILFTEPVIEPILQPAAPEITEEKLVEEIPAPAPAAPVKLTLNDILSGNTQGSNYQPEKSRMVIQDLKQAISLNDKLRYIKDLFNGYNLAYAEAIDLLNKMPDFKSADYFLQKNYAVKNNWSAKQETADQFYELLHQRFPD